MRVENPAGLHRALRCHRHREAPRRRGDSFRPDEHGRIRHGLVDGEFRDPDHAQSARPGENSGRFERRIGRGCGSRRGHGCSRIGHRRFDPPTRGALRMRGAEAQLRACFPLRVGRLRILARPDRPVHAHGRGRSARVAGHCRSRSARFHIARRAGAGLLGGIGGWCPRDETRGAEGVFRRGDGSAGRGARARGHRGLPLARCGDCRGLAAPHEIRGGGLLHHRHGRGLGQPGQIRRRALRAPRCGRQGSARALRPHARRGVRTRGETPHHPRDLRAQQRLLRRLLPARAKSAHAHPP